MTYIEHKIATENSAKIRKVDSEYDHIENIIESGVNKLPLFLNEKKNNPKLFALLLLKMYT
jgi:hypothetical protein